MGPALSGVTRYAGWAWNHRSRCADFATPEVTERSRRSAPSTSGTGIRLLADRGAFGVRSRRRGGRRHGADVDRAGRRGVDVRDARGPTSLRAGTRGDGTQGVPGRGAPRGGAGGGRVGAAGRGDVLERVGEVRLFSSHEVAEVRLHGRRIRLLLGVGELRDRDRGENADDHDDDQQLDECETLAVHALPPKEVDDAVSDPRPVPINATGVPAFALSVINR